MIIISAFLVSLFIAVASRIATYQFIGAYLTAPLNRLFIWPTFCITDLCITLLMFPITHNLNPVLPALVALLFCWATITAGLCDLTTHLLPRWCTLWMIPVGIGASYFEMGLIPFNESLATAACGYSLLWTLELFYKKVLKKDALGEGDKELLAMIGSFIGFEGMLATMIAGGFTGGLVGILLIKKGKMTRETPLPLGFFLCLGSLIYIIVRATTPFPLL